MKIHATAQNLIAFAAMAAVLAACGGGSGSNAESGGGNPMGSSYTIGGNLSGLAGGNQVTLLNNGTNGLTLTANGAFSFTTPVAYNGSYAVTVGGQPVGQTCSVTNGTGSGSGVTADVSAVGIACSANAYRIGGNVVGLVAGAQVTLENNGANPLTLTSNGTFSFTTPVAYNGGYAVTIGGQPTGQVCTVADSAGSGVTADVNNVIITCSTPATQYAVTPSGSNLAINSNASQHVNLSGQISFAVTPNSGHVLLNTVGGTCAPGSWNGSLYLTGPITANCTVIFNASTGTVRYSAPPGNGTAGHAGTFADPYQTIWENIKAAGPGDVIYLLPGTFTAECPFLNKSGTANNPIVMTGAGTAPAKGAPTSGGTSINCQTASGAAKTGAVYMIPAYVNVQNLTIGPSPLADSGLFVNSYGGSVCHNVIVDHITIHDTAGAGYQSVLCGALTITNSIFYNNGLTYATACTSGISLGGNIDDGTSAYNNVVDGNISYDNGNPPNCNPPATGFNSDGEGIIIDYGPAIPPCSSYGSIPSGFQCASVSRTLISNNIFFGNQGAGIEVFNGNNVDIVNNTLYQNQKVADHHASNFGEIAINAAGTNSGARSVNVYNNLIVPLSSNPAISCSYFADVAVSNNLNGNSSSTFFSAGTGCTSYTTSANLTGNPAFVNPATPNFQLQASSAARNGGLIVTGLNSNSLLNIDYTGAARSSSVPWDVGACEYAGSSAKACP